MGLTNAERQERYRQKLKAAARGADIGERARAAMDEGLVALWDIASTAGNDGGLGLKPAAMADLSAFRIEWALRPTNDLTSALSECRSRATEDQAERLQRAIDVISAALLEHVGTTGG